MDAGFFRVSVAFLRGGRAAGDVRDARAGGRGDEDRLRPRLTSARPVISPPFPSPSSDPVRSGENGGSFPARGRK